MEAIRRNIALLLLSFTLMGNLSQKTVAQTRVSFQLFYDNLSDYGSWIDDPNYGYVWSPRLGSGFAPYRTNGYWSYTDMGWTWVSYYPWGWAPFHYGRWFYDPYYGWLWVPDTQWGPAWVTWRYYDGYYGWAAIGPGISIDIAFSSGYAVPYNQWMFVREKDFCRRTISNYCVKPSNNVVYVKKSSVINNIHGGREGKYNAGPDKNGVQKRTGTPIAQLQLRERNNPGQSISNNEIKLYKPRVEKETRKKEAPQKWTTRKEVASGTERGNLNNPNKKALLPYRLPQQSQRAAIQQPQRALQKEQQREKERYREPYRPILQEQKERFQNGRDARDVKAWQQVQRPEPPRNEVLPLRNNTIDQPIFNNQGGRSNEGSPHGENNRGGHGRR